MLGRPAVLAGIKAFLAEPGARGVTDLRAALEKASGKDLKDYFEAWVFGSGAPEWPSFTVEASQTAGEVTVSVTQKNLSGKLYGCAVEVEVQGATTSARTLLDFGTSPSSAKATATVPLLEPLLSFKLDPDHRVVGKDITVMPIASPAAPKRRVWIL
jgi:aminopeptidase N